MSSRFVLAVVALTLLGAPPAAAAPDPLVDFLARNRCPVADRLSRLFDAGDPAQDRDRFLVVDLPDRGYGSAAPCTAQAAATRSRE